MPLTAPMPMEHSVLEIRGLWVIGLLFSTMFLLWLYIIIVTNEPLKATYCLDSEIFKFEINYLGKLYREL